MKTKPTLKSLMFVALFALMSFSSFATPEADSTQKKSRWNFSYFLGPAVLYPLMPLADGYNIPTYDIEKLEGFSFRPGYTHFSIKEISAKVRGGLIIGISSSFQLSDRFSLNFSPSASFLSTEINFSFLIFSPTDTKEISFYSRTSEQIELPISIGLTPFQSKPNFAINAGVSYKWHTLRYNKISNVNREQVIYTDNQFDFFLSSKLFTKNLRKGVELRFSYSLHDMIADSEKSTFFVKPIESLHFMSAYLLFHIW